MKEKLKKVLTYLHDKNERELASIVLDVINDKPIPKKPLKYLANDTVTCQKIAELLGGEHIQTDILDSGTEKACISIDLSMDNVGCALYIGMNGSLELFSGANGILEIPNCLQIADLILSKYKVE